jgi:hypothetical protein
LDSYHGTLKSGFGLQLSGFGSFRFAEARKPKPEARSSIPPQRIFVRL